MIYRMMVFGHRKCFGKHRVLIGSLEGVPGTPDKTYGPIGPRGKTHQPPGAGAPPIWAGQGGDGKGKEERQVWNRIPTSFSLPLLGKSVAVARVKCIAVAWVAALLIRRYS